ncbi:hypothetical protein [Bacillus sp. WP8]|uniref:hypothetical protein n=1 Tax=Bacillus sp. WP8 TaxID=756828 RepID=UPI00164343C8|nr:hypothetical protein [Bacillus sp. WP8]
MKIGYWMSEYLLNEGGCYERMVNRGVRILGKDEVELVEKRMIDYMNEEGMNV